MSLFIKSLLLTFIFLFGSPLSVYAATVTLDNGKATLQSPDEEYTIQVTLSINTANGTTYYLRGVFFKPNTSSYCGYTWNGTSWFSGPYSSNEGWKNFLPVTVSNNTWTGEVKVKIDAENNSCKDSGSYNFKIQRFTLSGSGNFDEQNVQTVSVTI